MDTLLGAIVGATIAGIVALGVTYLSNEHAVRMATDERAAQEKVRRRVAGLQSAKEALRHLNTIRAVFASNPHEDDPEQAVYEAAYQDALLSAVDIDDDETAKTLTDIAEVYWSSWLATEEGEWTSGTLSYRVYKLAQATVRAYTQGGPKPDRTELDQMLHAIESNAERRRQQEEEWRAEVRKEREEARRARHRKAEQDTADADTAPE
jgi:hypothetical protein